MTSQDITTENDILKKKLISSDKENAIIQQKMDILTKLLEENTMECRNRTMHSTLTQQSLNEQLEGIQTKYDESQQEIQTMRISNNSLKNSLSTKTNEYEQIKNEHDALKSTMKRLQSDLKQQIHAKQTEIKTINDKLTEANHINISLQSEIQKLKTQTQSTDSFGAQAIHSNATIAAIHSIQIQQSHSNSKDIPMIKSMTPNISDSFSDKATFVTRPSGMMPLTHINEQKQNDGFIHIESSQYFDDIGSLLTDDTSISHSVDSQKSGLQVIRDFNNDREAYDIWIEACDTKLVTMDTMVNYNKLYPLLCKVFIQYTACSRVPTKSDLELIILKNGAIKRDDNVLMKHKEFLKVWEWLKECYLIVKELKYLWDFNDGQLFLCNLFYGRKQCKEILDASKNGTFIIRLASKKSGVVVSYYEDGGLKEKKQLKHTLIIRKGTDKYEKQWSTANNNKAQIETLSNIILSAKSISCLYTPHNTYPKNNVFY